MSSGRGGKSFGIIELLAQEPTGLGIQAIAEHQVMALATAHRQLQELIQLGYVRKANDGQNYMLTMKIVSLAFKFLSASGIIDVAQPILDELARSSKELVRLAVVDGSRLTWVAKAQGAQSGLRYDPDMGQEVLLYCTASGQAWLAFLDEESALHLSTSQGKIGNHGPNAPRSIAEVAERLQAARERGYAMVTDSAAVGTSAMAAPIFRPYSRDVIGTVSIAGPSARLGPAQMTSLANDLLAAAERLGPACQVMGLTYQSSLLQPQPAI